MLIPRRSSTQRTSPTCPPLKRPGTAFDVVVSHTSYSSPLGGRGPCRFIGYFTLVSSVLLFGVLSCCIHGGYCYWRDGRRVPCPVFDCDARFPSRMGFGGGTGVVNKRRQQYTSIRARLVENQTETNRPAGRRERRGPRRTHTTLYTSREFTCALTVSSRQTRQTRRTHARAHTHRSARKYAPQHDGAVDAARDVCFSARSRSRDAE